VDFNPLDPDDNVSAYGRWREQRLAAYEAHNPIHCTEIRSDCGDGAALQQIRSACGRFNFCLYRLAQPSRGDKGFVRQLGLRLGLRRLDGNLCSDEDNISSIEVTHSGRRTGYIPYTPKPLTWHTDGYYNKASQTIRAMVLHCVRPAASGGENLLLDHEIAYIQLRDENPDYIRAFCQADALTIPPNMEKGEEIRPAQSGPVFSVDPVNGHLHMRFSARTRNIEWKNDSLTAEAVACMRQLLNENNPYVITYRMGAGEGIIANNVLHNRRGFEDGQAEAEKRLLYRARYYDRVAE